MTAISIPVAIIATAAIVVVTVIPTPGTAVVVPAPVIVAVVPAATPVSSEDERTAVVGIVIRVGGIVVGFVAVGAGHPSVRAPISARRRRSRLGINILGFTDSDADRNLC
jgi:hypothetical protein